MELGVEVWVAVIPPGDAYFVKTDPMIGIGETGKDAAMRGAELAHKRRTGKLAECFDVEHIGHSEILSLPKPKGSKNDS